MAKNFGALNFNRAGAAMPWLALGLLWLGGVGDAVAEPVEIILQSGDKIHLEVVEETDEKVVGDHPVLGRVEIDRKDIKVEEPAPIHPGLFGTPVLRGWTRDVSLGFSGASGNSQSAAVNAGLKIEREGTWYRGKFNSGYFFGQQRNFTTGLTERNTNSAFADYRQDVLFGESPFYLFIIGRYDWDQFQDFKNRVTAQGGVGMAFIDTKKIVFKGNVGMGVNRSWGFLQTTTGELVTGLDLVWNVIEGQKLTADTYFYPNLQNWSDIRLLSNLVYEISLGWVDGLALNVGFQNEYRSQVVVAPTNKNNNLKYYGALAYRF